MKRAEEQYSLAYNIMCLFRLKMFFSNLFESQVCIHFQNKKK